VAKAYDTSESLKVSCGSYLHKKISQENLRSSTWHTCMLNNESCRLKVAFRGRYSTVLWFWLANHNSPFAKQQ